MMIIHIERSKFDAVSRQIDMFNTFQMQISTMTKQALDTLDQRYAALGIKPQFCRSPFTNSGQKC
jgi:hypothetical protein